MWLSPLAAALTGMPPGESATRKGPFPHELIHSDDIEGLRRAMDRAAGRDDRFEAQFRFNRPDTGREVWLSCSGILLDDARGARLRVVGAVRDITREKGETDRMSALVAELDHRVKNVLASVQSLAAQSARRTISLDMFLKTFFGRLQAMAAAHTLLTATRWRGVEISHIAAAELGGLAQGQARWAGPDIVLNARATHALTLALHELSANAVKFGALSTESGRVELEWRLREDQGFDLIWTEAGGPIVTPPSRTGFGRTLLERVTARELGGEAVFDFRPEGLHVLLSADGGALAPTWPVPPARSAPAALRASEAEPTVGASQGPATDPDIAGVRVLIVEDAVLLALELESGLTGLRASVVGLAADLDEAMRLISLEFDVAVLDANLNGQSVAPVANALAERGTPFIFATGYGGAGAAPAGFPAPVVRKPYNIRQIATALTVAIAGPGVSAAARRVG